MILTFWIFDVSVVMNESCVSCDNSCFTNNIYVTRSGTRSHGGNTKDTEGECTTVNYDFENENKNVFFVHNNKIK